MEPVGTACQFLFYPVHAPTLQVVSIPCTQVCHLFLPGGYLQKLSLGYSQSLARALGFEPKLSVLETDVLPLTLRPPPSIF